MALILPPDDDDEGLAANKSWRIMFGLPFIMYGGMIIGFTFFVRYDSPKYYITNERKEMALRSIHNIYKTEGSDQKAQTIYYHLETKNTGDTSDVTLRQALFTDEAHMRASWVSVMIIVWSELTGFQAITLFSTTIFE